MARRLAFGIATAALLAAVAAPTAAGANAASVELRGVLELSIAEDIDAGVADYRYRLRTGHEVVQLRFAGPAPDGFDNGAVVKVRGHRAGTGVVAADGGASSGTVLASAPGWNGSRRLAVVLINFSNDRSKPFTRSFADGVIFSNASSVRSYFAEESGGAMRLTGTTFDWIRIPASSATCDITAWESAGKAGLAARGVNLAAYTNFMFVFPPTSSCHWLGLAYVPGGTSWINGTPTLRTTAHELGHNFGVHHASSLRCTSNGVRVALSGRCTRSEYGDPFTVMGAATKRHNHALARVQMGYLPASATATISASGTYTLQKAFATSGVRVIGIPRGDGTWFYLDYRRPYGTSFDTFSTTSSAVRGVTIRIAQGWTAIAQTSLIDTVPSTTTFADAPLKAGRTFRDYLTGITITVVATWSGSARVSIRLPADTVAPSAPGSLQADVSLDTVSLAWTAATDNRAVTGYQVSGPGAPVTLLPASSRVWAATGLAPATTYAWTVRAVDGAGNVGPAASVAATTLPPEAPPDVPPDVPPEATSAPS